ncbi:hypothetical protein [Occallatibacter savannae]|uniref:hypothetical protein n=1 Tax=Occallatibacter savannae TaxID=1002691 RepID=UPI000D695B8A|nr:hypothetical protein [Occallatibacter savannae]
MRIVSDSALSLESGYFNFGCDTTLFGRKSGRSAAEMVTSSMPNAALEVVLEEGKVRLPFDLSEVLENSFREAYAEQWRKGAMSFLSIPYYLVRPMLPVAARRHLQKIYLRGWDKLAFPRWPVDCSVDNLLEQILVLSLRATGAKEIPFIWFWPDGHKGCALMTHDVETEAGRAFCKTLMDIDDSFGVKASFQVIPEERYVVSPEFLEEIRQRGHEVAVHDLNHDGHLYKSKEQFVERAAKINEYGRKYKTRGFRAGVLYRKQVWYDQLDFAYDMSVPNVAHLDPQRGGCCTIMPYFIGGILEIPVTTIQDYTLFNILGDYSTKIWRQQTSMICEKSGLMSFIVHPDYVIRDHERVVYEELLHHIVDLSEQKAVWIATPGKVNEWWRKRAEMKLVQGANGWTIEGGDSRARVAYAHLEGDRLVYEVEQPALSGRKDVMEHLVQTRAGSTQVSRYGN